MKRPITLVGTILGVVCHSEVAICVMLLVSNLGLFFNNIDTLNTTAVYIFLGVLLAVLICAVVMNAVSIRAWKKDEKRFAKLVPELLTSIILSFTCLAGSIVLAVISSSLFTTIYCVYEVLFSIASIVLLIVDLALEKKRVQNTDAEAIIEPVSKKENNVEEKIQHLFDMKERGLISDEEFISLKEGYLKGNSEKKIEKTKSALDLKIEKLESMKERGLISEEEFKNLKLKYISESLQ